MVSAEFEALPTKGFEKHTCGSCMYLLPHRKGLVGKIKKGSGKGQFANWVCKCNDSPEFNEGRVCEDGTLHFPSISFILPACFLQFTAK